MAALLIAFLCGAGFHAVLVAVALGPWAIARRDRLDIRPALERRPYAPPESVGLRVVRDRAPMGEPPSFLPDVQALDEEHTHVE